MINKKITVSIVATITLQPLHPETGSPLPLPLWQPLPGFFEPWWQLLFFIFRVVCYWSLWRERNQSTFEYMLNFWLTGNYCGCKFSSVDLIEKLKVLEWQNCFFAYNYYTQLFWILELLKNLQREKTSSIFSWSKHNLRPCRVQGSNERKRKKNGKN